MPLSDWRQGMGMSRSGSDAPRVPDPNYTPTPNPAANNSIPSWIGRGMGRQGMPPMGGGPGAPPTGGPMNPPADPPTGGPMNPPVGDGPPMGQPPFGQQPMPSKEQLYMMHFGSQPPWVQNAYMQQWQQEAQAGQPLSTNWFNRGLFGMPENG